MELFASIVNYFQPLTVIEKSLIGMWQCGKVSGSASANIRNKQTNKKNATYNSLYVQFIGVIAAIITLRFMLRPVTLLKKSLCHRCFPVNYLSF